MRGAAARERAEVRAALPAMSPAERVACAEQLLESAQKYVPLYEEWERQRNRGG
jgi:hypothetical protein